MRKSTWLDGLNTILGNEAFPLEESSKGYRLLIQGVPGTGKTTLGLHLLHHQLVDCCGKIDISKKEQSKGLIIYYQEGVEELDSISAQFELDYANHPPDTALVSEDEFKNNFPFLKAWIKERAPEERLCILVDGLSLIKSSLPHEIYSYLMHLISEIPRRNLLLIIIAEEDIIAKDNFFEYVVDGVIKLSKDDGRQRHRFLEITKFRYIDYIRGMHGFEMHRNPDTGYSELQIYPNPAGHFIRMGDRMATQGVMIENSRPIDPAIDGLDEIIKGFAVQNSPTIDSSPLQSGDVFVITAEPGAEKVGVGLTFLSPITRAGKDERGVWVSFGPSSISGSLSRYPYGSRFNDLHKLFESYKINKTKKSPRFIEIDRESVAMHPDRVVSQLMDYLSEDSTTPARVIIDGLSNIGRELGDPGFATEYIIWLSRLLRRCNAVSIIFVDLPSSFQPIGNIIMDWEEEADFVGHLRWFEINNQLTMTFVLTKSRYPNFRSVPYYVAQFHEGDRKGLMWLEDRGWPMISMLSGRMDTIREAKVFLKFFDQNYSTRSIHEPLLEEFTGRYSEDQSFAHVFRTTPSPLHWSFRGYAGAGHSNTKIVCLKQYIMKVMESDNVLLQIPGEEWEKFPLQPNDKLPGKEYIKARSYSLWGLANRKPKESNDTTTELKSGGNMLPLNADIGVLCSQIDKNTIIEKAGKESTRELVLDWVPKKAPSTWDKLIDMNNTFQAEQERSNNEKTFLPPWIESLFALPSLTSDTSGFMAFFLELLVDHYGKPVENLFEDLSERGLYSLVNSDALEKTIDLLRRLVLEGISKTPLQKIHYHSAYFSRRWFSKINQYPTEDKKLPTIEKYLNPDSEELKSRLTFALNPLPTHASNNKIGFSCLEFYSVGVIRGALAPETAWMFISELASAASDMKRFEQRRGLPVLRENWSTPSANQQRINDQITIDKILDENKFFCNFWINRYWHIESKLHNLLRKIFINITSSPIRYADHDLLNKIEPKVAEIRKEFKNILDDSKE